MGHGSSSLFRRSHRHRQHLCIDHDHPSENYHDSRNQSRVQGNEIGPDDIRDHTRSQHMERSERNNYRKVESNPLDALNLHIGVDRGGCLEATIKTARYNANRLAKKATQSQTCATDLPFEYIVVAFEYTRATWSE